MNPRHTTSAAQALYHVFVAPALSKPRPQLLLTSPSTRIQQPHHHLRPFSHTPTRHAKTRAPEQRTQKWDNEITARQIYLVDPSTDRIRDLETGEMPEPRTRFDVLNSIDTKTHRLVQLTPDEPENRDFIPVCKIVSKKESYDAEKRKVKAAKEAKKVAARTSEMGMKTVELNWAIDKNDLGHRLDKMRGFLEEGRRVEVVLASKKRGRKASLEECEGVLERIGECVGDVEGAREMEGLKGKLGGFCTMVFMGRPIKSSGSANVAPTKEKGEKAEPVADAAARSAAAQGAS